MTFGQCLDYLEQQRGEPLTSSEMPLVRRMVEAGMTPQKILSVLDGEKAVRNKDTSKERTLIFEATGTSGVRQISDPGDDK